MGNMMKAFVYQNKGTVALEECPIPMILNPKNAIIKITMASICSSDLHICKGCSTQGTGRRHSGS